jgi:hypothetical protein
MSEACEHGQTMFCVECFTDAVTPPTYPQTDDGAPVTPQDAATPPRPHAPSSFFLTFGVRYAKRSHPRGSWIHPDGWVEVVAADYHAARTVVIDLFGRAWSDLYREDEFDRSDYPRGLLMVLIAGDGLIESEDHRD